MLNTNKPVFNTYSFKDMFNTNEPVSWVKIIQINRNKILDECFEEIFIPPYKAIQYNFLLTLFYEIENTINVVMTFCSKHRKKVINNCLLKIYPHQTVEHFIKLFAKKVYDLIRYKVFCCFN